MKAKIDCNGWLKIERAGKMKSQYCPYAPESVLREDGSPSPCGDWCPKFYENRSEAWCEGRPIGEEYTKSITICSGPSHMIVADERSKEITHAAE